MSRVLIDTTSFGLYTITSADHLYSFGYSSVAFLMSCPSVTGLVDFDHTNMVPDSSRAGSTHFDYFTSPGAAPGPTVDAEAVEKLLVEGIESF